VYIYIYIFFVSSVATFSISDIFQGICLLCKIKVFPCPRHEGIWGSRGIAQFTHF
jgi:hypothetical protein